MANSGSAAPEKPEQQWGFNGCFVWGVLLALVFGVIALFPWARQQEMSLYPNINGIYVSIAATVIAGGIAMILYSFRRVIPLLTRLVAVIFAGALLAWLTMSILNWLFWMEAG